MVLFDIIIVRFVIVSLFRDTISTLIQILKIKILLILKSFTKTFHMDIWTFNCIIKKLHQSPSNSSSSSSSF
jgi:hypothetical protein